MSIEKDIFKRCIIDNDKLIKYGFIFDNSLYKYSINILDDSFRIDINIKDNVIQGKIYDLSFNDEYTLFRSDTNGDFVGKVRNEFISLLTDIKNKCTFNKYFIYEQSNRIMNNIFNKYGDGPSFEWERTPGCAAIKNRITGKWYGLIMNIDKSKLDSNCSGEIEVLNIKLEPEEIQGLIDNKSYYPAYHMNKKYWISIILDDSLLDETILNLIDKSYSYTLKRTK